MTLLTLGTEPHTARILRDNCEFYGDVVGMPHIRHLETLSDFRVFLDTSTGMAHNPEVPVLVASYGDLRRVVSAGYRNIAMSEHGCGQSYGDNGGSSYIGWRNSVRDSVGLLLMPNEMAAAKARATPGARVVVVGSPFADRLPHKPYRSDPPVVALSFHWDPADRGLHIPEMQSAFTHYQSILPALRDRFPLIGHAHPRMWGMAQEVYRSLGIEPVRDFHEVCRRADIYVCDNSSTLYEFASTGRPVVVLNAPWYRRDVNFGLRFWSHAAIGRQVDDPRDLLATIANELADPTDNEALLRDVFPYPGEGAERFARALAEWVE